MEQRRALGETTLQCAKLQILLQTVGFCYDIIVCFDNR
jgi:hypothetical protein